LVVARKATPEVGDIVVYRPEGFGGAKVIHRIVGGDPVSGWQIQGDNNDWLDQWRPTERQIVGVAQVHFGGVGAVTAFFLTPWPWVFVLACAVGLLLWPEEAEREDPARR